MKKIYALFLFLSLYLVGFGQVTDPTFYPLSGASGVEINPVLTLTFDDYTTAIIEENNTNIYLRDLDNSEFDVTLSTGDGFLTAQDSRISFSGNTITIDLSSSALDYGTNYAVVIYDNTILVDGSEYYNELQSISKWTFTTAVQTITDPSFYPTIGASGVEINPILTLTFDDYTTAIIEENNTNIYLRDLDNSEFDITLSTGDGLFTAQDSRISFSGNTITIDLSSSALDYSTNYAVIIYDNTILVDGTEYYNKLQSVSKWTFTTADPPIPIINTYSPVQDETGVSLDPSLQITFDQDVQFIDPSVEYKIFLRQNGTTIDEFIVSPGYVDGNLAFDGNLLTTDRLTITPYSTLDVNTEYNVIIPSGLIESTLGGSFDGITSSTGWRFWTLSEPEWATGYPLTRDITPTSVDLVGQTNSTGTYYYVVTASATAPTADQIKAGQDESGSPTTYISGSGAMTSDVEFVQAIDISDYDLYDAETTYYVHLIATDDVNSLDSSIGTTSFTTLERTAPVTSFDPIDGATDISISTNIIISFDEPVRMTNETVIDDSNVASLINFYIEPSTPVSFTATINAEKTIITIIPDVELTENTTYGVSVFAVEDYYGNQQLSSSSASFTTSDYIVWDGDTSTEWLNDLNWDVGFTTGVSIRIPASATYMPIISTDVTVGNIIIEAGASLEITSSGSLTVNESIVMESSTTDPGNASLIDNGSTPISVDGSSVFIYQQINASDRTYYVSSPVTGATKSSMGVDNAIGSYNNTTDSWYWMGDSEQLSVGTGYALRTSSDLTFTGDINSNSSYGVQLTRTDGEGYGWNYIGNPYPAALDWDAIGLKTNINDAYWIFLNDATNYGTYATYSSVGGGTYGLDNIIPSNQGFFVKVLIGSSSGSITMPKTALSTNDKSILKGAQVSYPKINIAGVNGIYEDETIIAFADIAEDGDDVYDASKKFGTNSNFIQLFSYENSEPYAINCKSELTESLVVPLGYSIEASGAYQIKVTNEENIFSQFDVMLEDKYSDETVNLAELASYSFTATETGKVYDRFAIHFIEKSVSTDVEEVSLASETSIYSYQKTIYISGENIVDGRYEVYDTNGRLILNGRLNSTLNTVETALSGIFIVKVIDESRTLSEKVLLK